MDKYGALKTYFGYDAFREGQEGIVDNILAGRDALCIMPTGAGKSMCFQLPALLLQGVTIVVSPLISLMKDQVGALVQSGVPAAFFNSSLTESQYSLALMRAGANAYKLIYVAPERLLTERFLDLCRRVEIALVAVDEAHCVSQWGQDFRPSYLDIPAFVAALQKRPVVAAFTATATARVKADIEKILKLENPKCVTTGFDRPNLRFEVETPKSKDAALLRIAREKKGDSGIVYCSTRKTVEAVHGFLSQNGVSCSRYHAGLPDDVRRSNQDDFTFDRTRVMVATNAFGMGIDKADVRFVVHYNMPKDMESYYQEAGRAGRDGANALCTLLFGSQDVVTARYLIENGSDRETLSEDAKDEVTKRDYERLRVMTGYCHTTSCLRAYILRYFGEEAPENCGNCSNCDGEFCVADATAEAVALLGFVRDTNGRLGAAAASEVLRGGRSKRILDWGMDRRKDYGSLSHVSAERLREVIRALLGEGFLTTNEGQYPTLTLGERAAEIFGGAKFKMKTRVNASTNANANAKKEARTPKKSRAADDGGLFEKLRALRRKLADEQNAPPFVVFSDAALIDMCEKRPKTASEFLQVSGVGRRKLEQYGEAFLKMIKEDEE